MSTQSTVEVLSSANATLAAHDALLSRIRNSQKQHRRQLRALPSPPHAILSLPLLPSPPPSPSPSPPPSPPSIPPHVQVVIHHNPQHHKHSRPDLPPAKRARLARYRNYVPEEETIRNDYSQRYVDGGEWPQNWVTGADPARRFEEYPKQRRLLALKKASVNENALPPTYVPYSALSTLLSPLPAPSSTSSSPASTPTLTSTSLPSVPGTGTGAKFDVILLDPPYSSSLTFAALSALPIPQLAADPCFLFLWVGSGAGDGLERGRELLAKWGFRRCEDVVWAKTNAPGHAPGTDPPTTSLLTRTKQHCLMGIKGTVRRSTDGWFVHCNVDTDVIIWEGDPVDPTRKPPETYTLIENFCLGLRRLEIFGKARSSLRRGWVTVLQEGEDAPEKLKEAEREWEETGYSFGYADTTLGTGEGAGGQQAEGEGEGWSKPVPFDRSGWERALADLASAHGQVAGPGPNAKFVVPMTPEIDALRPKSPVRGGSANVHHNSGGGGPPNMNMNLGMGMPMGMNAMNMNAMNMNAAMNNLGGMRMGPRRNVPMNVAGGMGPMPAGMNAGQIGGMGQMGTVPGMGMGGMGQMGGVIGQMGGMGQMPMGMGGMNIPNMPGMPMGNMGMIPGMQGLPGMQGVPGMMPNMGMQGMQGMFMGGEFEGGVDPNMMGMMGQGMAGMNGMGQGMGMMGMNQGVGQGMPGMPGMGWGGSGSGY